MRVSILTELPPLLREMGHDPEPLLAELGLEAMLLADPENVLPFRVVGNVLNRCVMLTGCAHFGLLLGQRGGTVTLGNVGLLALCTAAAASEFYTLSLHVALPI